MTNNIHCFNSLEILNRQKSFKIVSSDKKKLPTFSYKLKVKPQIKNSNNVTLWNTGLKCVYMLKSHVSSYKTKILSTRDLEQPKFYQYINYFHLFMSHDNFSSKTTCFLCKKHVVKRKGSDEHILLLCPHS